MRYTFDDLERLNSSIGHHFFDDETMEFFEFEARSNG